MHLSLHPLNVENILLAEQAFPAWWVADLKASAPNYHGSLVGRFVVSTYIHKETGVWHDIPTGMYQLEDKFYFSYAHTDEFVLVAVHEHKVWVDLEIIKPRDTSLLHQYHVELEHIGRSDRESFYTMRTAKEALIKYLDLSFDAIESIQLLSVSDFDMKYGEIHFNKTVNMIYHGEQYSAIHGQKDSFSYALCVG